MSERQATVDTQERHPGDEVNLSFETLFDVLGSSRRRFVLSNLSESPTPVRIDDLAECIAAAEEGRATTDVTPEMMNEIEILLYHVHLPKMADVGLVTYDASAGIVEPGEAIDGAHQYLELAEL
ncbi:hypothetical protein ACFFQF_07010 [Haladaptatus pallidirubidus]|uniref:DUF7344 domain-containing protein n=1 Tax=Haladaptatus pallidirubidus TaxID=1008152 RepID=A0AAV3UM61_9EURY|nr:hypothetical protein [Haladaptatus pallidirubidus]